MNGMTGRQRRGAGSDQARWGGAFRQRFACAVVELEPVRLGIEVSVNIGTLFYALVTRESVARLALTPGAAVWISFKSTAVRFIAEQEKPA